jgi:hypothetical protein
MHSLNSASQHPASQHPFPALPGPDRPQRGRHPQPAAAPQEAGNTAAAGSAAEQIAYLAQHNPKDKEQREGKGDMRCPASKTQPLTYAAGR